MFGMMRPIRYFCSLALMALCFGLSPSAANSQSVFEACDSDIAAFCSKVTPGNGRIMSCLYAHEDKITETCDAAVGEIADIIDTLFAGLRYTMQQCKADIAAHCTDVAYGEGRIISCLHEKKSSISDGCRETVENVKLPNE
jgi:hypothetical protein